MDDHQSNLTAQLLGTVEEAMQSVLRQAMGQLAADRFWQIQGEAEARRRALSPPGEGRAVGVR